VTGTLGLYVLDILHVIFNPLQTRLRNVIFQSVQIKYRFSIAVLST
jgi:hypothetical protein